MALQAYEMEGNEMYKQLAALNDADATEYERLYNSWSANAQTAQQMYQNEYTAWADSVSNAMGLAGLQMDEFSTMFDVDFSYAQLAQDQKQYESDLAYRYAALAQDQKQFEANLAAKKGSGVVGGKVSSNPVGDNKKDNLSATDIKKNVNTWLNITGEFDDEDAMKYIKEYMDYGMITTGTAKKILDEVGVDLDDWDEFYEYQTTGKADQTVNTTLGYSTDESGNYITASGSKISASKQQTHKQKALEIVREEGPDALDVYLASLGLNEEKDVDYLYSIIEYVDKYSK
jgi:hypothetical protein